MNVAVIFGGYQPTAYEAIQFMDIAMGGDVHTYISTLYHVDDGFVTSTHLFVLNSDTLQPVKRDGSKFNAPEVMFFATPMVEFDSWRQSTKLAHDMLMLRVRDLGLSNCDICPAEYEDGSLFVINKANDSFAKGMDRLILNAYTNMVFHGAGEVHSSIPMPIGTRYARMLSVENGRYLDGILYESSRDRLPGDGSIAC